MWLLARSKPSRELWACENIKRQGYPFYLPRYLRRININRDGKRVAMQIASPLFPTYVFVQTDGSYHFLLTTFGICGVVMAGDRAAPVPEKIIHMLKKREQDDGFISLPPPPRRLQHNQPVQITRGTMTGQQALFLCHHPRQRVQVLLDMMGTKRVVTLAKDSVRAA